MDILSVFRGLLGILVIVLIAFLFSNNKRNVNWRLVIIGLTLQFIIAVFIIKGDILGSYFAPLGWIKGGFKFVSGVFVLILNFTSEGSTFIFGSLGLSPGTEGSIGMFFAFQVLPVIIFFASLMAVLYHLGIFSFSHQSV